MAATRRHFCAGKPHYRAHFFVFTDHNASTGAVPGADVTFVHKRRLGWPRDSDDRYSWLLEVCSMLVAVFCHPIRPTAGLSHPYSTLEVGQFETMRGGREGPRSAHATVTWSKSSRWDLGTSDRDLTQSQDLASASGHKHRFSVQAASLIDGFDYALWMDADNHLVADCCEDLLGTLVALRHGWSYSSGTPAAVPHTPACLPMAQSHRGAALPG